MHIHVHHVCDDGKIKKISLEPVCNISILRKGIKKLH